MRRTSNGQRWFTQDRIASVDELTSHLNDTSSQGSSPHPQDGTRRPRQKAATKTNTQHENDFFRDVSESGVWGRVTTQEIYLVGFLAAAMVLCGLGYIVSVVIGYSSAGIMQHQHRTSAQQPPAEDLFLNQKELYAALLDQITHHPSFTNHGRDSVTAHLPYEFEQLAAKDAYSTAAEWLLFSDPSAVKTNSTILPRFVLAVTYFANNGPAWLSKEHWLSDADVCEWQGIVCELNRIVQVDLANNNLTGTLHSAWGMLEGCLSLLLGDNALSGTIDEILATPSDLLILRLQNNRLSGTIPPSFVPKLDTMYVHGNMDLTGTWSDCESFKYFGIDCDRIDCECCSVGHNCF